jgi:hypothetical protein
MGAGAFDRMRKSGALGAFVLMLTASMLAGCASVADEPAGQGATTKPAPKPQANETTGAIAGRVLDEEQLPLPGVTVGLKENAAVMDTDSNGNFTFNGLKEGVYTLIAQRLGYDSFGAKVPVGPGQVVERTIVLKRTAIPQETYIESTPISAYIELGHAWTDYYGGWDVLPTCSACEFYIPLTPTPFDMKAEASWVKPIDNPAISPEIYYLFRKNTNNNTGTITPTNGVTVVSGYWTYSTSMPVNMEANDNKTAVNSLKGVSLMKLQVGGGFYGVAFQQRVEIWISFAYNGPFPDDFTAFPPPDA